MGAPVFIQYENYRAKIKVFEEYINIDNGNSIDKVPVIDGKVRIQNDLAINTNSQTYQLNNFGGGVQQMQMMVSSSPTLL